MQTIQWAYSWLVPKGTSVEMGTPKGNPPAPHSPLTWCSEALPYFVPPGMWLGLVDFQLGSKFSATGPGYQGSTPRSSYLVVQNVLTVPDHAGSVHLRVPAVIPPGHGVHCTVWNNDDEDQWMNMWMSGLLVPQVAGQTWQDAFAQLL